MFDSDFVVQQLQREGIAFSLAEHPAVFTCEQAREHLGGISGKGTKNLFLRDKKGRNYFLIAVPEEKAVDLAALATLLDTDRLGFGSPDSLRQVLGVEPGSVTLLGLINDTARRVRAFLDRELMRAELVQCHPLRNTATVVLSPHDLCSFLARSGVDIELLDVPSRSV